jgi:hypothetical protein
LSIETWLHDDDVDDDVDNGAIDPEDNSNIRLPNGPPTLPLPLVELLSTHSLTRLHRWMRCRNPAPVILAAARSDECADDGYAPNGTDESPWLHLFEEELFSSLLLETSSSEAEAASKSDLLAGATPSAQAVPSLPLMLLLLSSLLQSLVPRVCVAGASFSDDDLFLRRRVMILNFEKKFPPSSFVKCDCSFSCCCRCSRDCCSPGCCCRHGIMLHRRLFFVVAVPVMMLVI